MTRKWMIGAVGLASLAAVGAASAAEPATGAKPTLLTADQMDRTTAGQALINISGNNVQIAAVVQAAVVLGSNNSVTQSALALNYFSYPSP